MLTCSLACFVDGLEHLTVIKIAAGCCCRCSKCCCCIVAVAVVVVTLLVVVQVRLEVPFKNVQLLVLRTCF